MKDQMRLKATNSCGLTAGPCQFSSVRHVKRTRSLLAGISMFSALTLLGTTSAQAAAYSVQVQSSAGSSGQTSPVFCHYNFDGTGCSPFTTGMSGSVAPSTYVAPGATHASATAHEDGASLIPGVPNTSASAAVSADLSTASLHLSGFDTGVVHTYQGSASTNSFASLTDMLHFTVAGAVGSTVTAVGITFTLEGAMHQTGTSIDGNSNGEIGGGMHFGRSDARFDLRNYGAGYGTSSTGGHTVVIYLDTYPDGNPGTWTTNADHTVNTFTETYNILGAAADIYVDLYAGLQCSDGMACDYGNTAKFALSLAPGTSFSSDSGVFLKGSGAVGGVPEPASWALMLAGLGVIGATLRRRRALHVQAFAD